MGRVDRLAVRSRSSASNKEGLATECSTSVARHGQVVSRMLTSGDVGDWNAAVDQV